MNIWTEQLQRRHLPLLECWIGRVEGAVTPNDLPREASKLTEWFERCMAEPGRLDCLALIYETPVGITGLRQYDDGQRETATLYLMLGEVNYNPLRTATYITLRMLDRAFLDIGLECVTIRVCIRHAWYLNTLEQMGFSRTSEQDGLIYLSVEKKTFLGRKYLF